MEASSTNLGASVLGSNGSDDAVDRQHTVEGIRAQRDGGVLDRLVSAHASASTHANHAARTNMRCSHHVAETRRGWRRQHASFPAARAIGPGR